MATRLLNSQSIEVFVGTFNANARSPNESFSEWLLVDSEPDIYVIGCQEIVGLNPLTVGILPNHSSQWWEDKILDALDNQYVLLVSEQLVGVLLLVFVKPSLCAYLQGLRTDSKGVGFLGVGGNKGGVAISFRLFDTNFLFINSHLAAHQDEVDNRRTHFVKLAQHFNVYSYNKNSNLGQLDFQLDKGLHQMAHGGFEEDDIADKEESKSTPLLLTSLASQSIVDEEEDDHCHVFWLGDLNYRVDLDAKSVYDCLQTDDLQTLLQHDQLNKERKAGNAFPSFEEGPIHFRPTYRYTQGSHDYELKSSVAISRSESRSATSPTSEKREDVASIAASVDESVKSDYKEIPSWCDRILWMKPSSPSNYINQIFYRRAETPKASDHKAVAALFKCHFEQRRHGHPPQILVVAAFWLLLDWLFFAVMLSSTAFNLDLPESLLELNGVTRIVFLAFQPAESDEPPWIDEMTLILRNLAFPPLPKLNAVPCLSGPTQFARNLGLHPLNLFFVVFCIFFALILSCLLLYGFFVATRKLLRPVVRSLRSYLSFVHPRARVRGQMLRILMSLVFPLSFTACYQLSLITSPPVDDGGMGVRITFGLQAAVVLVLLIGVPIYNFQQLKKFKMNGYLDANTEAAGKYGCMYLDYRDNAHYWALVRHFYLFIVGVLIGTDLLYDIQFGQYAALVVLHLIYANAVLVAKPYRDPLVQRSQSISAVCRLLAVSLTLGWSTVPQDVTPSNRCEASEHIHNEFWSTLVLILWTASLFVVLFAYSRSREFVFMPYNLIGKYRCLRTCHVCARRRLRVNSDLKAMKTSTEDDDDVEEYRVDHANRNSKVGFEGLIINDASDVIPRSQSSLSSANIVPTFQRIQTV